MENKIAVIGTGPGSKDYLTFIGFQKIEEAEVLVGAKRLLTEFKLENKETYPVNKDLKGALKYIKENYKDKKVAVLVTGDTGVYSLASFLKRNLGEEILEFYPGISSLQLMFARLQMNWVDAHLASFHGTSSPDIDKYLLNGKTVGLLTDNKFTPQKIAEYLLSQNVPETYNVAVGANLSYENEKIFKGTLGELKESTLDFTNSVMVIYYG